jgi:hypothetical protein
MIGPFLFLDIDGVLNNIQYWKSQHHIKHPFGSLEWELSQFDPANSTQLERIVTSVPDLKIVVSSSWRKLYSLTEIKDWIRLMGAPNASKAIIDKTGSVENGHRGSEIDLWLAENTAQDAPNYVILDDSTDMLARQLNHFVCTDSEVGLTAADADHAIAILNGP